MNNLVKYLNGKYHPKYFKNFKEFCTSLNIRNQSVDDYTDDYVSENENYIIALFNDSRDFNNMPEDYCDDIIISYDKESGRILKFYYTGYNNLVLPYVQSFIDIDKTL